MSDLHEPLLGPESKETEPCFAAVCVDDKLEMNDRTIVWIETQESSSESKDKWSNIVQQSLIFVVCLILGFFIAVSTLPQVSFPMNFSSSNVVQEPNLSDSSDLSQGIYSSYVTSINSKDDFHSFLEENDVVFVNFFVSLSKFSLEFNNIWQEVGEKVEASGMPVGVANVDCNAIRCTEIEVFQIPTLRWYENSVAKVDYGSEKSSPVLIEFARHELRLTDKFKDWEGKGNVEHVPILETNADETIDDEHDTGSINGKWTTEVTSHIEYFPSNADNFIDSEDYADDDW